MGKLYARVIILFALLCVQPALLMAQCTDSAYFKIKAPYCVGTAATFTNLSTGATTGFSWNFGDPASGASNTSVLSNPSHAFSGVGTYNVCLIAKYANPVCNDTFCTNVVIDNPPVASFTFSPNNQCSEDPVQFLNSSTGNGLTYSWNFGDPGSGGSNTSTLASPQHEFAAYGAGNSSYTVKLVVTNAGGCQDSVTQTVTVLQRPNASLTDALTNFNNCSQATSGNPSFSITVTNTSTTNGINANYTIIWGDGTGDYNSTTFTTTTHTYASLGIYTLTFIVVGTNGCSDTAIYKVLNISNPSIGFSSPGSTAGCAPKTYCFAISSFQNNDPSTIYHINFGDGSPILTFTHPPPDSICHNYTSTSCGQPGNQFTAMITALDACDSTSSTVNNIKIFTSPITAFTVQPDTIGCVNQAFTFLNTTTGAFNNLCSNTTTFTWNFGDGSPPVVTNSMGNQTHAYTAPGTYWVTLSSSNYCNPSVVDSQLVCVNPPPVAGFTLSTVLGCAPLAVTANNTTVTNNTCGITIYTWAVTFNSSVCTPMTGSWGFAGGTNMNSVNPSFTFLDPGTYTVSLKVDNKCIANTAQTITVKDTPNVKVAAIANFCGNATVAPTSTFNSCYGNISSFIWTLTGGNPSSSNIPVPGNVVYDSAGTYTVIASVTNECGTINDSVTFTVHPLPTVTTSAAPDTICIGKSSTLTTMGAITYKWSPATGLSATTGSTVTATPPSSIIYQCIGTDAFGCVDTDSVAVVVNPNLVITVSPSPVTICAGDSALLTATGASIYTWFPAAGLGSDTGAAVYAHPATTTAYTVKDTTFASCPAIGNVTVNVNPLPAVSVTPLNPAICPAGAVNLTANGASTYVWTPANGLSVTTGATVTASPAATTIYTVTGTDANGCTNTTTITVTVNLTLPVDAGPDSIICIGSSIILTPNGGVTYVWSPAAGLSCTACSNPNASPASTTVYTVIGTDNNGCTGTDSVTVRVSSSLSVNAGADQTICPGSSASLTVVSPGATTYQWTPANGLSCTTCVNPTATPASSTAYIVTASDGVCSGTDTVNVILYPTPVANAGHDATICVGSDTILTATGGASYLWSPVTGLSCTACQSATASPLATTIYTVTVTDANGCTASDNTTITVIDTLTVDAGPDQNICLGSSYQINTTAPGANTYSWTPATDLSCTNCPDPVTTPRASIVYVVTASNGACSANDTVAINVVPIPDANAGPAVTICDGSFTTLNASGGANYSWSPFAGLSNPFISNPFASPTVTTTYVVVVSNFNCMDSDSVVVTVNALPIVTVSNDSLICNGTSVSLTASGAVIYTWLPVSGLNNANINNPIATPLVTITYIVTGSDAAGCSATASVTLSVVQPPNANAGQDAAICYGESVQLNGSGGITYLWLPSAGLSDSTIADPMASPTNTTTYTVFVSNGSVCPLSADTVLVIVHPLPVIKAWPDTTIVAGTSIMLNVTGGGIIYTWYPAATLSCTTCQNPVATPSQNTSYIVTASDSFGCRAMDTVVIDVDDIITLFLPNSFSPGNHDNVNDVFQAYGEGIYTIEMDVYNRWGQKIFESKDPQIGWDGTCAGRAVLNDVYVYQVKAVSITGKSITKIGTVTVLK